MSDKARLPKISVRNNNGSIQIRFKLNEQFYSITGLGRYTDLTARAIAEKICADIKHDLLTNQFDSSLHKYSPIQKQLPVVSSKLNSDETLSFIWELYKRNHPDTKESVKVSHWRAIDRLLAATGTELWHPLRRKEFINACIKKWALNTLDRLFRYLSSASTEAWEADYIQDNYWKNLYTDLPKLPKNKRAEQYYTADEVQSIIEAFTSNRFTNPNSRKDFKHSYYAPIIEFLLLTGCRPQDAIGLTWDKIKSKYILFDEAITLGYKQTNKNEKIRKFPINHPLQKLIENLRIDFKNNSSLVFPSINGKPLRLTTLRRVWKTVITELIKEGILDKYLPPYNLRNTAITLYSQAGVADKDLAKMMGTSTQMIDKHYKGIRDAEDYQLPEI